MSIIDDHTFNQDAGENQERAGSEPVRSTAYEAFVAPQIETVTDCLRRGRKQAGTSQTMSQPACVDILLDCHNAAVRPTVRHVAAEALAEVAHVNLVRTSRFLELLDVVYLALAVDAAFDHLDLAA